MTAQERTGLERAIERAGAAGVKVLGVGRIKSTAQRFWIVSSTSHPDRPHILFLHAESGRLSCDCPAGQHGRICVHRAAVHMHLTVQAARIAALDAQVEAALREEEEQLHAATRTLARTEARLDAEAMNADTERRLRELNARMERDSADRETAPLYRSNAPISPFATVAPRQAFPSLRGGGAPPPRAREEW